MFISRTLIHGFQSRSKSASLSVRLYIAHLATFPCLRSNFYKNFIVLIQILHKNKFTSVWFLVISCLIIIFVLLCYPADKI